MECKLAREFLSPYLDGELESSLKISLSEHLQTCSGCRRELEELEETVKLLRWLPELTPAPGFWAQLREQLSSEETLPAGTEGDNPAPGRLAEAEAQGPGTAAGSAKVILAAGRFRRPRGQPGGQKKGWKKAFSPLFTSWPGRAAGVVILLVGIGIALVWSGAAGLKLIPWGALNRASTFLVQEDQTAPGPPAGTSYSAGKIKNEPVEGLAAAEDKRLAGNGKEGQPDSKLEIKELKPEPERRAEPEQPLRQQGPGLERKDEEQLEAGAGEQERKASFRQPDEAENLSFFGGGGKKIAEENNNQGKNGESEKENNLPAAGQSPGEYPARLMINEDKETVPHIQGFSEKTPGLSAPAGGINENGVDKTAAPLKKIARQIRIEIKSQDLERITTLLDGFKHPEEAGKTSTGSRKIRIEIASARFPEFLKEINSLGVILAQEEKEQDLTKDYAQVEEQLAQKQARKEELEKILLTQSKNNRSKKEFELSLTKQELTKTEEEICALQEQLQAIDEKIKIIPVEIYWPE